MDFTSLSDKLLFAVPKKGRLHENCMNLLKGADIQFVRKNRLDIALSTNLPIAIVFLPASDIAEFVGEGNIDIGITGQDVVAESGVQVMECLKLGFGKCRLALQVPISSDFKSPEDLVGKRIVTSFDQLTKKFYGSLEGYSEYSVESLPKLSTSVHYVSGSVEAACALGLADAIVDLVESGDTMRAAKLHDIHTLLTTEAVLIMNQKKEYPKDKLALIKTIQRRIQGVIDAQKYVLVNYNVSRSKMKDAISITPGKKAPTVSPLEDTDWVAVSAMISKKQTGTIMDQLEAIGATDILVFDIQNCRV